PRPRRARRAGLQLLIDKLGGAETLPLPSVPPSDVPPANATFKGRSQALRPLFRSGFAASKWPGGARRLGADGVAKVARFLSSPRRQPAPRSDEFGRDISATGSG